MGFYSRSHKGEEEEDVDEYLDFPPKEKEEFVTTYLNQCSSLTLQKLFEPIELLGILPDILQKAADINDENSKRFLDLYRRMSQLEEIVAADDAEKFSQFLADNSDFVLAFPPSELLWILCCWRCSTACVKALFESSLAVHFDANQFPSYWCSTPLEVAARNLCLPLTQTLLNFGADVHYTRFSMPIPLSTAVTSLWHRVKLEQTTDKDLFYKLSSENLREGVETIYLLAKASCSDFEGMLKPFVFGSAWVALPLLLVIALRLIMCPPSDGPWSMDNTPVATVLSSVPRPHPRDVDRAWSVLKSVWDASQELCKMFFDHKLTPSSGVKEEPPFVMLEYFQQYINAHSLEVPTPSKRARSEAWCA